jgi:KipI family sensor histidine kinase inhibitor
MDIVSIEPLGDTQLTLRVEPAHIATIARFVRNAQIDGVTDVVASYATIGVHFDPARVTSTDLADLVGSLAREDSDMPPAEPRSHVIRTRYDGEDLHDVAERTGLSPADVVEIHSSAEYRVLVVGFVPGFAYLGALDERLALPRRESPRKRVPPGSVAIAERQTGIYPSATPGGWHIIGTTGEILFDPRRAKPALFEVGDTVRFTR